MPISIPGYVPTQVAVTGTATADWANAIRDRAPQVFATAALRDAAITSPIVGQTSVITTGTGAGEFIYSGAVVGWTQPWNQAWGVIATAVSTTDQTGITAATDITGMSITWTALANRLYKTSARIQRVQQLTNLSEATFQIVDGAAVLKASSSKLLTVNEVYGVKLDVIETGIGAGSTTRKVRAAAVSASLSVNGSTNVSQIWVEDCGPNGAPS